MTAEQANANNLKQGFLLAVFFGLFIFLGLWQILLIPFFQGPDEQVHYATVQYWTEPAEKTWTIQKDVQPNVKEDIRTWHFSEEIREAAYQLEFDQIKWQSENTSTFLSNSPYGKNESEILNNTWQRVIDTYPISTSGTWSLYYFFTGIIESWLIDYSILDRFFAARLLSLTIGLLTVLLVYLTARKLGWGRVTATTFSSLVAFQPMFLATAGIVNIDIFLILAFTLFFLGSIYWLMDGPSLFRGLCLIIAVLIGIFSKGPGIVLFGLAALLFGYSLYRRYQSLCREKFLHCFLGLLVIATLFFVFVPAEILADFLHLGSNSIFSSPSQSIVHYLEKTASWSAFEWTSQSYWGNFGWLDAGIPELVLHAILGIEILALFGLMWLFLGQNPPRFLPNKQILLFALLSILALQFAIRFFDWRVFDVTGKILIGTPGRYFLPNIVPHLLLVVSGLGYWAGTRERFQSLLRFLAILMFLLTLYCSWFIILPRYYL